MAVFMIYLLSRFKLDPNLRAEITEKLPPQHKNKPEVREKILSNIEKALDPRYAHLLTVCKPVNSNAEIDVAILLALLKAEKENTQRNEKDTDPAIAQLWLALEWNRIDVAKKYIFNDELKDKINSLGDLMYKAIKDNKVEFVDLFLDNGFSMKGFLTDRVLLKLYNEDISDSLLSRLLIKQKLKLEKDLTSPKDIKCYTYKNIGNVIEYLIDDFYAHKFCKAPYRKIGRKTSEKILSQTVSDCFANYSV
jgi:transient receptor potential cation channel subfamily M protein 6